jgi:hypothetical protein
LSSALTRAIEDSASETFFVILSVAKNPGSFSAQNTSTSLVARGAELLRILLNRALSLDPRLRVQQLAPRKIRDSSLRSE